MTPLRRGGFACALTLGLVLGCSRSELVPNTGPPLRIGLRSDPLSLDPHFRNELVTLSVLGNVYEGLTAFDAGGRVAPLLAERWENPDDLRWRLRLRQGVFFHDGSPLEAADVVFSIERARNHPGSDFSSLLVEITEVRASDTHAVVITTARPYPILLNKLAFIAIVPRHAPTEIRRSLGTGPYRLISHRPGDRVCLEAAPGYRLGPAVEPRVEYISEPDPAVRLDRLLAGELDVVHDVRPADIGKLENVPCCRLTSRDGLAVEYLAMRASAAPFDDIRVREAIDLALDRPRLVREKLGGYGTPLVQLASGSVFGHDPTLTVPERDLEEARQRLADADVEGLSLTVEFREGRSFDGIREQLLEAGIEVRPVARPWPEMYRRLLHDEVDFYMGGIMAVTLDVSDVLDSLVHTRQSPSGYGQGNELGFSDPEIDRLIELASSRMVIVERRATLWQALRLLAPHKAYVPLYSVSDLYGVRRVVQWEPPTNGLIRAYAMRRGASE